MCAQRCCVSVAQGGNDALCTLCSFFQGETTILIHRYPSYKTNWSAKSYFGCFQDYFAFTKVFVSHYCMYSHVEITSTHNERNANLWAATCLCKIIGWHFHSAGKLQDWSLFNWTLRTKFETILGSGAQLSGIKGFENDSDCPYCTITSNSFDVNPQISDSFNS